MRNYSGEYTHIKSTWLKSISHRQFMEKRLNAQAGAKTIKLASKLSHSLPSQAMPAHESTTQRIQYHSA